MAEPVNFSRAAIKNIYSSYASLTLEKAQSDAGVDISGPGTIEILPAGISGRSLAIQQQPLSGPAPPKASTPPMHVAIVGAGVAGLYASMILQSVGIKVDVLEASDRTGGRLYTHKFNDGGEWDYFDVGAMRFPHTDLMQKTFDLFDLLDIPKLKYSISRDTNFMLYNNVRKRKSDLNRTAWLDDPFKVFGSLPKPWVEEDPSILLYRAVHPWLIRLRDAHLIENPKEQDLEMRKIFQEVDRYSTRSYLNIKMEYPFEIINWIETTTFGTGWFDRAFVGGSETIIKSMEAFLNQKEPQVDIKTNHQVTAVKLNEAEPGADDPIKQYPYFTVSFLKPSQSATTPLPSQDTYSHVIFAIPPPCIRMIDTSTCELDFAQRQALREIQLAPSSKIGMKFKTAWWKDPSVGITEGGQSTTDRVARTIVYPSQGNFTSTVLIVSYCWTQDSLAIGALMDKEGSPPYERLKQVMLEDLAEVHKFPLEKLIQEYEHMYPFDWSHNPNSIGAFGLFGPSQFNKVYPSFARPAARGQMHFIGETFSTIHGWVAGALESAERGVTQLVQLAKQNQDSFPPPPPTPGKGVPTEDQEPINADPLEAIKVIWKPQYLVDEVHMLGQVALSLKLQKDEFKLQIPL
ncbi:hypothetical protein FRC07_011336 [Ceratobasidium sp. 392]|nr:hypothetical protein FRC07_011336 [Ceratobasidium sp. 392]